MEGILEVNQKIDLNKCAAATATLFEILRRQKFNAHEIALVLRIGPEDAAQLMTEAEGLEAVAKGTATKQ